MLDFISSIIENIISLINDLGYLGIFIGMTIESSFFPFPSEVILVPAGVLISRGEMSFLLVFLSGLLGSLVGASINYAIAFFLGRTTVDFIVDKYGKFLFITSKKIKQSDKYFKEHGEITTFIGRLIFVIRQLISLPAGFSRMNFWKFLLFTGLGAGIWTLILILTGYFFGNAEVNFLTKLISLFIAGITILIAVIYSKIRKNNRKKL